MTDPAPTIRTAAGVTEITWQAQRVKAMVSRMHTSTSGDTTAELHLKRIRENGQEGHLELCRLNLLSSPTKTQLAKKLNENCPLDAVDAHWGLLIEQLALIALNHCREGDPVLDLTTTKPATPPSYLLDPLLQWGQPTVLFGLGGTFKSYLAMMLAVTVALPYSDNRLGLWPGTTPRPVLYLDWETDYDTLQWRLHKLKAGMHLPDIQLHYRRCAMPLSYDQEAIAAAILNTGSKFVVVDSVGPACGGDLMKPEIALGLYGTLRYLGPDITTLLIHHTAKEQPGQSRQAEKTPFGSVYFINGARSVYEVRSDKGDGSTDDSVGIAVIHRKANNSPLAKPWGLSIAFGEDSVTIKRSDVADNPQLAESLSVASRMIHQAKRQPTSILEFAEAMDITEAVARTTAYRLVQKGVFVKTLIGKYAMKADEPDI